MGKTKWRKDTDLQEERRGEERKAGDLKKTWQELCRT